MTLIEIMDAVQLDCVFSWMVFGVEHSQSAHHISRFILMLIIEERTANTRTVINKRSTATAFSPSLKWFMSLFIFVRIIPLSFHEFYAIRKYLLCVQRTYGKTDVRIANIQGKQRE